MKILLKSFYAVFAAAALAVTALAGAVGQRVDGEYKIIKGQGLTINTSLPVVTEYKVPEDDLQLKSAGEKIPVSIKLFGFIPVADTSVEVVDETYVAVLGTPFGIRIYTDGVLVVNVSEVETEEGKKSPASAAGIKAGDTVLSIDGTEVSTNEDVAYAVENSDGREMLFLINRDGKEKYVNLTPVKSVDGGYKAGIFVRDSSAGVGTLTFYSPAENIVCGLGHGITDEDTGKILNAGHGQLVTADIVAVTKGKSGTPGELRGRLTARKIATLLENCEQGVYGDTTCKVDLSNLTEIALKQEVYNGAATLLCTTGNDGVTAYSCTVKLKNNAYADSTQNFTVTVTDKALLEKTGGIVQGMSGSPLIQNGKLIGAITHVLVDDPTTGYAIFAENMLETAQTLANKGEIKDAS